MVFLLNFVLFQRISSIFYHFTAFTSSFFLPENRVIYLVFAGRRNFVILQETCYFSPKQNMKPICFIGYTDLSPGPPQYSPIFLLHIPGL